MKEEQNNLKNYQYSKNLKTLLLEEKKGADQPYVRQPVKLCEELAMGGCFVLQNKHNVPT